MKSILAAAVISALSGTATAGQTVSLKALLRVADSSEACVANCANQADACKRVCPTTYNVPCLSACDSQAQTCRQGCRGR
jgi:hypothetical protein